MLRESEWDSESCESSESSESSEVKVFLNIPGSQLLSDFQVFFFFAREIYTFYNLLYIFNDVC